MDRTLIGAYDKEIAMTKKFANQLGYNTLPNDVKKRFAKHLLFIRKQKIEAVNEYIHIQKSHLMSAKHKPIVHARDLIN